MSHRGRGLDKCEMKSAHFVSPVPRESFVDLAAVRWRVKSLSWDSTLSGRRSLRARGVLVRGRAN